ncbi:MAG: hypothetical protein CR972_03025 [Candidatus Moraniibacteriota bacterium]|nr:MAG: hypothetical protein CR972_03025 [Candidatus Moranbacteria bacterium]
MYNFFPQKDDVIARMSTQNDGNMRLRNSSKSTLQNRCRFFAKNHIDVKHVVSAGLVHGTNVEIVESSEQKIIEGADALVTRMKNVFLSLTIADCFPVFFYEQEKKIVGIAHAGWRGVVGEIVPRTINVMIREGADPHKICVAIGPGVSLRFCDFDFCDVIKYFGFYNQDKYIVEGSTINKVKVDLHKIILDQLRHHDIFEENIYDCADCTYANQHKLFSARRDGEEYCVMMSFIGMLSL